MNNVVLLFAFFPLPLEFELLPSAESLPPSKWNYAICRFN